jgi:hypothetical protein
MGPHWNCIRIDACTNPRTVSFRLVDSIHSRTCVSSNLTPRIVRGFDSAIAYTGVKSLIITTHSACSRPFPNSAQYRPIPGGSRAILKLSRKLQFPVCRQSTKVT